MLKVIAKTTISDPRFNTSHPLVTSIAKYFVENYLGLSQIAILFCSCVTVIVLNCIYYCGFLL